MKVLIVYTNSYRMLAAAPLGASLVASRLRKDGHQVRLLDLMFDKTPAQSAAWAARVFQPDLIGYSIRNVDNQSPSQFHDPLPTIKSIVSAVRAAWPVPTLLGGTAFTTFPTQFLSTLEADFGIAGDDLEPISHFVASLESGSPDLSLPGLVYHDREGIHCNPYQIRGYADTAFDGWDLMRLRPYRRSFEAMWDAGIVVRTGCPFKCIFCDTHRTYGREWVLRDPKQVADELLALKQIHGVHSVFLADAGFNRPLDHAKAVLEAIIRADVGVGLNAVFEHGEGDREFARLFQRAGGQSMMLFAFSLSESVLAAGKKPFQVSDVMREAAILRKAGVNNFLYLTMGGYGETPATVEETMSRIPRISPVYTLMDHGFRIQPGTELRDVAVAQGIISPEDDCFKATFYHSPDTAPEMLAARIKGYQSQHRAVGLSGISWGARFVWDKVRP